MNAVATPVIVERRGNIAIVRLNRPEARNAMNMALANGIEAAVDEIEADPAIRCAVLCANSEGQSDPIFCAGADLKALQRGEPPPLTPRGHFGGFVFRQRETPFVAAVEGAAIAGGCEMALACDVIVASRRARFAMPEVSRNLFAGAGAAFRLPALVGRGVALDPLLSTDPISAERAWQLGMVSRLAEEGGAEVLAIEVAEHIAAQAPLAVQWTRRVVLATDDGDMGEVERLSADALAALGASEDRKEGLAAFAERRAPQWTGR
ncbi:MAG: enoyl-CoA hydratase-related protein [Sphingobium sp.]